MPQIYRIRTWDIDLQKFTRQKRVPRVAFGETGLRKVLRRLREMGYDACRGDASVLVERVSD